MIEKYNLINSCINKYLEEKLFNRFNINIGIQLISTNKKIENLIKIRETDIVCLINIKDRNYILIIYSNISIQELNKLVQKTFYKIESLDKDSFSCYEIINTEILKEKKRLIINSLLYTINSLEKDSSIYPRLIESYFEK
jgi:hypothetical protein